MTFVGWSDLRRIDNETDNNIKLIFKQAE
ncbi:hypothetical protein DSUL_50028 [Desulfovibrionales bacterium]